MAASSSTRTPRSAAWKRSSRTGSVAGSVAVGIPWSCSSRIARSGAVSVPSISMPRGCALTFRDSESSFDIERTICRRPPASRRDSATSASIAAVNGTSMRAIPSDALTAPDATRSRSRHVGQPPFEKAALSMVIFGATRAAPTTVFT